ncbi:MFS transporter [Aquisalinus flavus]|nr:MFS transporter [Aquisalinus flavus]
MAGMEMSMTMHVGMALIPVGLIMAFYGMMPRLALLRADNEVDLHFHAADRGGLTWAHWTLVFALFVAVAVDVMKPATLGFVMPGMTLEYRISQHAAGTLALVALTGTALGSIIWGRIADLLGRRSAILLSALMFIGTAICGAMPSFTWNLIMCFLMGLSAGGLLPIAFTLMAEMVPAAHRGWLLVALGGIGTSAGYLLASGAAAVLEPMFSWRILWMLGLPTGLMIILLNRYIPESPRFLASVGLRRQARAVLDRYNAVVDSPDDAGLPPEMESRGGFWQLMTGGYGAITLGLIGSGLAWGLVNFGFLLWLPTNLREMGMDAAAANGLLAKSGMLALPGIVAVAWLYHAWSSIRTLVLFVGLTAASLFLFFVIGLTGSLTQGFVIAGTACLLISASGVIAMLIPYAAEIYPVHLRGTGAGIVAASSKAGGILGAGVGVVGFFENIAFSALWIAVPLIGFALLLLRSGTETRGFTLEAIHSQIARRR